MMRRLLTIACIALAAPAAAQAPARPNIVILLADDWGFTDVGSFGGEIRTPHIDALAMRGVRFSNFHVAGFCSPTRAMLQTGVSSHRAGLGNMPETIPPDHVGKPGYDTVLTDRVVTIAERLRAGGYRTYFTGKWHLGGTRDKLPYARGYDRAFALADSGADNFEQRPIEGLYLTASWTEDGKPATLPSDYYSSTFIVDKMIAYAESGRQSGKPFFASLNFLANHIPIQAPEAYIARNKGVYDGGWTALRRARRDRAVTLGIVLPDTRMVRMASTIDWSGLSPAERAGQARAMEAYGAMAEAMDHEIGRLIAHLKKTGEYDNTIFVFLSDNGAEPTEPMNRRLNRLALDWYYDLDPAHAGRPGTFTSIGASWASAGSSPLSGYKFSAGEGGLRVPMIFAWPGNRSVTPGQIAPGFTHVTDIAPTLLALVGVAATGGGEPMRGADLTPVLTGAATRARADDQPLGYEMSGNSALFRGDYKLVRNLPPLGDGRWRLYDIIADPGETRDLAAADPARARVMLREYAQFARRDGVLPMPAGYTADDQIIENAFRNTTLPQLKRAIPWLVAGLALVAGLVALIRRRRRANAS